MMLPFLEQFVMKARYADEPEQFKAASPISYVHRRSSAVLRAARRERRIGSSGQARAFSAALREAGAATVSYAELANAHHAFDITPTVRSRLAANAVARLPGRRLRPARSSLWTPTPLSATPAS